MNTSFERRRVTAGQEVLSNTINQLKMLGTPPLGPEFTKISGTYLNDSLVIHRLCAKFEKPLKGKSDLKKQASIQKMLDYDKSYAEKKKNFFKSRGVVSHFYAARAWLHETLRDYKISSCVEFPSGESVQSNRGYVDLFYKLRDDSQWTVSSSCVKLATRFAYNNHSLRKVVKERYKAKLASELVDMRATWVKEAIEKRKYIGFYVFSRMFLSVCTIVGYSRITTVPKNNSEDRVISCDPTWNLIVQRGIALGILDCVKKRWGVDIQQLQSLHRSRIAFRGDATIDFSKASDSNWYNLFLLMWPKKVANDVEKARTGLGQVDGDYHVFNQLAPMGCGFTFEIMTLTLMAYGRVLDPLCTVFGDDVIINQKSAPRFMKTVENLGWVVNVDKTFVDGNFSESCGGFYNHTTREHIVSHDMFYPENFSDIIAAANKLSNILRANQVGGQVRRILLVGYVELLKIIPSVAYTWDKILDGEEASRVWVPKSIPLESFDARWKGEPEMLYKGKHYGKRVVTRQSVDIPIRRDDVKGVLLTAYMYSGVKNIGPREHKLCWETYRR